LYIEGLLEKALDLVRVKAVTYYTPKRNLYYIN